MIDNNFKPIEYAYPWDNLSLANRIERLCSDKKVIVYLYENPDNSTFRYRVYNVFESMKNSSDFSVTFFYRSETKYLIKYINRVSLLIFCRLRWFVELDSLISLAKAQSIKLVYDIDDCVYDSKKIPLLINTLDCQFTDDSYAYWFSNAARFSLVASYCDAFIGTNEYLKNQLQSYFKKPSFIIPNFLNKDQIDVSYKLNQSLDKPQNKFSLGYFSGSPSHNKDFQIMSGEIATFLESNSHAELIIVGFLDFPRYLQKFISNGQIKIYPFQNYISLQKIIASVDINLIPLQVNQFTNCKSELKFFEAGIVRVMSIASPTYVYSEIIQDGKNGYIAKQGQWLSKIYEVMSLDANKKSEIQKTAYNYSLENYFGDEIEKRIHDVFLKLLCDW